MEQCDNHDCLSDYDRAIQGLIQAPDNLDLKHKAVLALARAGSLDFALSEYARYGLSEVRGHEDIMALGGRLSKDLFLASSGKAALKYARDSAAQYEAAFQDTQGYYSGINAATMSLIAGLPIDIVHERVQSILNMLPQTERLTAKDHYFIEATRAECFLLLGQKAKAEAALRGAINFDPLNYNAHASTIKQFRLILEKQSQDQSWLSQFLPPRPVYFAGHIWTDTQTLSQPLHIDLSDLIQKHDIGFGYGALAAGADITIAEALLAEGAELHVVLPTHHDTFIAQSVWPYGASWLSRFKACLDQARSVYYMPCADEAFNPARTVLSARMAMGQAILKSRHLDVSPLQLLISDPGRTASLTACHKSDWRDAKLDTVEIAIDGSVKLSPSRAVNTEGIDIIMAQSAPVRRQRYKTFDAAMAAILTAQNDKSDTGGKGRAFGLDFDLNGADQALEAIMNNHLADTILVTEPVASYVALKYKAVYNVTFAGNVITASQRKIRTYILRPFH